MEHHFRELLAGNKPPPLAALVAEYHRGWEEREFQQVPLLNAADRAPLDLLAERMLQKFRQSESALPRGRILAVEEELRGQLVAGLPEFLARVDLVVETPAELVVVDWKSSRARWSAEQMEESAPQLLLYAELVREYAPGKPVRIEFAVLTKTKEVLVEQYSLAAEQHSIDRAKRIVERVWRAIASRHFYPAPSLTACPGCPYREPCRQWRG